MLLVCSENISVVKHYVAELYTSVYICHLLLLEWRFVALLYAYEICLLNLLRECVLVIVYSQNHALRASNDCSN